MDSTKKNDIRCPVCLSEFEAAVLSAVKSESCPICGTTMGCLKIAHDGYIKINWQDIRVLAIYAQRWASTFEKTKINNEYVRALKNIVESLKIYQPKNALSLEPPATLESNKVDQIGGAISSPYFKHANH